jgi:hypothetical protein
MHSARSYAQALHRAIKPGARLYMFELGAGALNGVVVPCCRFMLNGMQ